MSPPEPPRSLLPRLAPGGDVGVDVEVVEAVVGAWEKQVLSARGLRRVGRHSEYAI